MCLYLHMPVHISLLTFVCSYVSIYLPRSVTMSLFTKLGSKVLIYVSSFVSTCLCQFVCLYLPMSVRLSLPAYVSLCVYLLMIVHITLSTTRVDSYVRTCQARFQCPYLSMLVFILIYSCYFSMSRYIYLHHLSISIRLYVSIFFPLLFMFL